METTAEEIPFNEALIVYGGFWQRFWALMIDALIVGIIFIPLVSYNEIHWKSFLLYFILILIMYAYILFFQYKWGATIGKMILKLKIVKSNFQNITIKEILLRNSISILFSVLSIIDTFIIFHSSNFDEIITHKQYLQFVRQFSFHIFLIFFNTSCIIVDTLFFLTNNQKKSLHDRIGKTLVIKTNV